MGGQPIVQAMLLAAILVGFFAVVGSIACRVTPSAVEVLILGRVVRRISLDDIEEVHRRGAFVHESWSGLRFWNAVTLRRRRGLFRNVIVTPDDPDRFMDDLSRARQETQEREGSTRPG